MKNRPRVFAILTGNRLAAWRTTCLSSTPYTNKRQVAQIINGLFCSWPPRSCKPLPPEAVTS